MTSTGPVSALQRCWGDATALVGVGLVAAERRLSDVVSFACRTQLQREFPHLAWITAGTLVPGAILVDESAWRDPASDLYAWDAKVLGLQSQHGWLLMVPVGDAQAAVEALLQVLTRYQRLAPRLNAGSQSEAFLCALALHRTLHDLSKPLVRADYEHALDVWQWLLRLDPDAERALQLAALFHDIERLTSEPDQRIEQHADDYQAFKTAHAEIGARLAAVTARAAGVDEGDCLRMQELIEGHEQPAEPSRPLQAALLADADALSFFSLNSRGFADYYGPEHTRRKVEYTLGRMTPRALAYLSQLKLSPEIQGYIIASGRASMVVPRALEKA
jgi:hypothetical protein